MRQAPIKAPVNATVTQLDIGGTVLYPEVVDDALVFQPRRPMVHRITHRGVDDSRTCCVHCEHDGVIAQIEPRKKLGRE